MTAVLVPLVAMTGAAEAVGAPKSTDAGGTCAESGTAVVTFEGAGLLGRRTGSLTFRGTELACRTPDASIHSGVAVGSATITLDCAKLEATDAGRYTIKWDNGRESVIAYTEKIHAGLGHSVGTVLSGEFRGDKTWNYDLDIPSPMICVANHGFIEGLWNGVAGIGGRDPGGAVQRDEARAGPFRGR